MTTNNVTKYLKFANVQMAAESLFSGETPIAQIGVAATRGEGSMNVASLQRGNTRASQFTSTQATEFTNNWELVEHQTNTKSGFSGTLLKAKRTDASLGITAGDSSSPSAPPNLPMTTSATTSPPTS